MTRIIWCLCLLAMLAGVPARAETGAIVIVSRSEYHPGDDRLAPVVMRAGYDVAFHNMDVLSIGPTHSMTSNVPGLFDSGVLQSRESTTVVVSQLPPGTYGFHCSVHEDVMHGTLIIL